MERSRIVQLTGFKSRLFNFVFKYKTLFFPWNGKMYTIEKGVTPRLENHELGIHGAQCEEMGPNKFFFYGVIWLSIRYGGWEENPLEIEAVKHQYDLDYVKTRDPFAWKQYA